MAPEVYPCYVKVKDDDDEMVEIPTKSDGTMMLSSVKSQFPGAVGLRFRSPAGIWRGVKLTGNILDPPIDGWGDEVYAVLSRNKASQGSHHFTGPAAMLAKMATNEILSDMIVLGLPYAATDEDLQKHFSQFGELESHEIKYDKDKKSRGFGFIRFKTVEAVAAALKGTHILHKRRIELNFPKQEKDNVTTKLFIGRLPQGTNNDDLREHFSEYGVLKDVYIPQPFRGYGFVSFGSKAEANYVLKSEHVLRGVVLNVSLPTEKNIRRNQEKKNNSKMQGSSGNMDIPCDNIGPQGFVGYPGGNVNSFNGPEGMVGGTIDNFNSPVSATGGMSGLGVGFPGGNMRVNNFNNENFAMNMAGFNGQMGTNNNMPNNIGNSGPGGNMFSNGFNGNFANSNHNLFQQRTTQSNKPSSPSNYVWHGRKT